MPEETDNDGILDRGFRLGEWLVEPDLGRISHGEEVVHLRLQLMDLLVFLARRAGSLASKTDILDGVWPEQFVAESAVTRCIAELRQALGDEAQQPRFIETVPKRGYRLLVETVPVSGTAEARQPPAKSTARRWLLVVVAGAVAVSAVAGILYLRKVEKPRIVVVPFKNLGLPEDEYFADGMTSELISRLSVVSGLEVISTTSSMYYKGTDRLIRDIGRELDAEYALEGEVRWERPEEGPGRVRITPQLIQIESDTHVWSGSYDRDIGSIFEVQSDIAEQVIAYLRVRLLEPERLAIEAIPTNNIDAYYAYLRGLDNLGAPGPDPFRLAIKMFERAVELDPEFALAHAAVSYVHSLAYGYRSDLDAERMAQAKRAADRALELDPNLPEGHLALGLFYGVSRDHERALAEFRTMLALRPNDVVALAHTAMVQRSLGEWREAVDLGRRAVRLDPQNDATVHKLAYTYFLLRRYQEAADTIDRAIAIAPDNGTYYTIKYLIELGWHGPSRAREVLEEVVEIVPGLMGPLCFLYMEERSYEAALACYERVHRQETRTPTVFSPLALSEASCYDRMGEPDRARQKLEEALDVLDKVADVKPGDPAIRSALGLVYAGLGRTEDAIREGERAVALLPVSKDAHLGPMQDMWLAVIYASVGEHDAALDRIEYLLSIPGELSAARLRHSPMWDPLRDHPRFQEILEKYGDEP